MFNGKKIPMSDMESGVSLMSGDDWKTVCLNINYSTTRVLARGEPEFYSGSCGAYYGGLRTKGYHKAGYRDSPLISIIMPVRNREKSVENTIKSVIEQYYENVEFIVIDGASTDKTLEIIRRYEDSIDLWLSEPDKGVYDAMNKGISLARGKWLNFIGSDDIMLESLNSIAEFLRDQNHIYYGNVSMLSSGKTYGGEFTARKIMRKNISHQAMFYPRRVFDRYRFDLKYSTGSDHHFNIRCFGDKQFTFVHLPVLVTLYDDLGGLSSNVRDISFERDFPAIIRDSFGMGPYIECLVRIWLRKFERNVIRKMVRFVRRG
jgi:glycosyltransferase involved in cell wall biosynthesis